jgi:hypothetical protein
MKKRNEDGQEKFPDLSGDGEVTMKDILMGRGVIKKAEGGSSDMTKDPRYKMLMDKLDSARDKGDTDAIREIESDLAKEFGVGMMGGGSIDEKMKYDGGGDIMIKTVEISMKVPEKQKRGTGAAMSGTKFSGTY